MGSTTEGTHLEDNVQPEAPWSCQEVQPRARLGPESPLCNGPTQGTTGRTESKAGCFSLYKGSRLVGWVLLVVHSRGSRPASAAVQRKRQAQCLVPFRRRRAPRGGRFGRPAPRPGSMPAATDGQSPPPDLSQSRWTGVWSSGRTSLETSGGPPASPHASAYVRTSAVVRARVPPGPDGALRREGGLIAGRPGATIRAADARRGILLCVRAPLPGDVRTYVHLSVRAQLPAGVRV